MQTAILIIVCCILAFQIFTFVFGLFLRINAQAIVTGPLNEMTESIKRAEAALEKEIKGGK